MSDFQVKADAVDVEAIMRQIRARIREKRGVDYTEAEVQALASAKLEQFLDPKGVRSDLVDQFKRRRTVSAAPPKYSFEDSSIYDTHRGLLRTIRRLLNPVLKLFMNPQPIGEAFHIQAKVNEEFHRRFRVREGHEAAQGEPRREEELHEGDSAVDRASLCQMRATCRTWSCRRSCRCRTCRRAPTPASRSRRPSRTWSSSRRWARPRCSRCRR